MIPTSINALRGDTIKIPIQATKSETATYRAQLRQSVDTDEFYPLEIDGNYIVVSAGISANLTKGNWYTDLEETAADGTVTTIQATTIYVREDITRDFGDELDIPSPFNAEDLYETMRKTLQPSCLTTYLADDGVGYTTASIPANTPTKVVLPVQLKNARDFEIAAGGGAKFTRDASTTFKIFASTSMTTGTNNVIVDFYMYRNGVAEPGVAIERKVATGGDVGAMSLTGEFTALKDDVMEIYVQTNLATTITFLKTSFVITEKN